MSTIVLRPLEEEHLPVVLAWVNTPFVHESIGTVRPISMAEHRRWYERLQADPTRLVLVLCDPANSLRPVGLVGLSGIDLVYRTAELWLYLGERANQRRGYGRTAVAEMLELGFGRLGLHRIYAHVFEHNETALGFFASCGFRQEGRLREAVLKHGRHLDKIVFGMLASDFAAPSSRQERERVQAASVRLYNALASAYDRQPHLAAANAERVGRILGDLRARAPGGRLLDVGCGTGFVTGLAAAHFDSVEGIDLAPAMVERVPRNPRVHVQVAAAEAIPFPDASFDVVTAYGVLHHLHELAPALAEIRRVLRPGGLFYADEIPTQDCRNALASLAATGALRPPLRERADAVRGEAGSLRDRLGLDPSVIAAAMYQNERHGGLTEERVAAALLGARFMGVRYEYRQYLGQAEDGPALAAERERFLRGLLPVSRPLFEYAQLVASAAP